MCAQSDELAAIGFSYEISVLRLVSETVLDTLTSSSTSVEFFTLPQLAVAPNRFDPTHVTTSPVNIIQMTPKGTQAINAFVKLHNNCIVLIQVSTQTSNHTGKVQ